MALLWSRKVGKTEYQVRNAGNTVRLYTNGVFHSQFNPTNPFSGGLWDCLSLPGLLLDRNNAECKTACKTGRAPADWPGDWPEDWPRVLVLGVGGGAVLRQLHVLFASPRIVGIDLDAIHLSVARRWFGVNTQHDLLIHADAQQWLSDYSAEGFDIIVEDLFGEKRGEPVRAVALDQCWSQTLLHTLKPGGMIIANCVNRRELRSTALLSQPSILRRYRVEHPLYENSIGVFMTAGGSLRRYRQRVLAHPALGRAALSRALGLQIKSF